MLLALSCHDNIMADLPHPNIALSIIPTVVVLLSVFISLAITHYPNY
jgi:hypothetical protein